MNSEKKDNKENKENEEKDYKKYLNEYFQIKNKYEEKQRKAKTLNDKNKCIKCRKQGGTIFSNKNNRYTAVCGADRLCGLHIELYRGFFSNSTNLLYQYREILENSKELIIMLQNNEIFHYPQDELKKKYENEKNNYETVTNLFTELKKCLYDNEEIREKIKEKINNINKVIIEIRSTIEDYKKSKKNDYITNAVEQQRNVLMPLLEELLHLKYEVVEEDVNQLTKTTRYIKDEEEIVEKRHIMQSVLIERQVALEKEEINLKEPPAVIKWQL